MSEKAYVPFFTSLVDRLVTTGTATHDSFIGCTAPQILEIEADQGVELPLAYQAFLRVMGRGAEVFQGTDYCYPEILGIRDHAKRLLARGAALQLPEDAIVFMMHQGYQFAFICAHESEDPPVYHYMEGDACFQKACASFTGYLMQYVGDFIRLR